jgi:hypothetical protein
MSRTTGPFKLEAGLAGLSALLFLLTLAWRDWIEIVFGVDPDHGNGSLEWIIVALTAAAAVVFAALARAEWRRTQDATT